MLKKIIYIFDKRQKRNLCLLTTVIGGGAVVELIGVSAILPLINLVMTPDKTINNKYFKLLGELMGFSTTRDYILFMAIALIFIYIFKNIYLICMYDLQYRYIYNNQKRLANRLLSCYMKQDYLFHISKSSSELLRNVAGDVPQFFTTILAFIQLFTEICVCIALALFLLIQDFLTTMSALVIIIIFTSIFFEIFKRYSYNLGVKSRIISAEMTKCILQAFNGIKETKVLNKEKYFVDAYNCSYEQYSKIMRKQSLLGAAPKPIIETICFCSLLGVLAVRVYAGINADTFIPTLAVFAVSAFRLLPSFNRITGYLNTIMFNKAAVDSVYHDLREINKLDMSDAMTKENEFKIVFKDSVNLNNITFKYPDTEAYVLSNINLEIPKNKSIAFIGASGAGKTTLADVFLGLLTPEEGKILVNGVNVLDYLFEWHKKIGYIPQTIYLMDDTIRKNIVYGISEENIDEIRLWNAIQEAQLEAFIRELPQGINTPVGEAGVRLSGGQRQRIGIARALYNDPEILVLDEATSALDNETESAVMEAINSLKGTKTMIIIAHRLTTIKNCDMIYEVKSGSVVLCQKEDVINGVKKNGK